MTEILVVGAGPVGLTLASELARHGVTCRIIEKNTTASPFCRAIGITPRSLEVFEDIGIVRDIVEAGIWLEGVRVAITGQEPRDLHVDLSDLPYAQLGVPQYATEAVLERHLASFGVTVERDLSFAGLSQTGDGCEVKIEGPRGQETASFRYVVGCDGAHSGVRRALGIGFTGEALAASFMLGDVHIDWKGAPLPRGMALRAITPAEGGAPDLFVVIPLPERDRYRVSMVAPERFAAPPGAGSEHGIQTDRPDATLADLQEVADRLLKSDAPVLSDMRWSSIFRISMRLADRYRVGRAFIAGDASHIHPPTGGQGMNTGIQDAYNLAWKMALVVRGLAGDALLDSYEAERRPVAADVVARTSEQTINFGRDKTIPERLADSQLLISYRDSPLSSGSLEGCTAPGDRAPDAQGLRRQGMGFPLRLFDLLKGTQHVLLVWLAGVDGAELESCAAALHKAWPELVRVVGIAPTSSKTEDLQKVQVVQDAAGEFSKAFDLAAGGVWLVRPDNYISYRAKRLSEAELAAYFNSAFGTTRFHLADEGNAP